MNAQLEIESKPLVVNVQEAGRLLGIKQTKVYDLMRTRELPFLKIGRSTRIELTAILAFVERQRTVRHASGTRGRRCQ
ncbi:MAG: helix-turn-helix domain-containing protein [Candidatus Eremiobacteraeota bacterium]|nr:helix-turn-helix domain-containing protein [Candidatus Eremiobacteraeota bacterium]MBC5827571.1 helix-turn-helix domain-containing protein [Candidatus Eremiobacteraeota bacterium]